MGKRKNKNRKGNDHEYCPGYHDSNGIWNTGFNCPRWGDADRSYCCGSSQAPFCCPKPKQGDQTGVERAGSGRGHGAEVHRPSNPKAENHHPTELSPSTRTTSNSIPFSIPLIAGALACFILFVFLLILCLCHPCCPLYKKRRRQQQQRQRGMSNQQDQCPGCRHQVSPSMGIGSTGGRFTQSCPTADCGAPSSNSDSRPSSFCPMCRAEGLRWQHGVSDVDLYYPIDEPPPYIHGQENHKEFSRPDVVEHITSFSSFAPAHMSTGTDSGLGGVSEAGYGQRSPSSLSPSSTLRTARSSSLLGLFQQHQERLNLINATVANNIGIDVSNRSDMNSPCLDMTNIGSDHLVHNPHPEYTVIDNTHTDLNQQNNFNNR